MKSLPSSREIFCSDEYGRAAAVDQTRVLLPGVVGANDCVNSCGLQCTAREVSFYPRWKHSDRYQVGHISRLPESTAAWRRR